MYSANLFEFRFNPFNVPDPDRKVEPLDSGFPKAYRQRWEELREVVEPVLAADPMNLCVVVADFDGKCTVVSAYSFRMHHEYGKAAKERLEERLFGSI